MFCWWFKVSWQVGRKTNTRVLARIENSAGWYVTALSSCRLFSFSAVLVKHDFFCCCFFFRKGSEKQSNSNGLERALSYTQEPFLLEVLADDGNCKRAPVMEWGNVGVALVTLLTWRLIYLLWSETPSLVWGLCIYRPSHQQ